MSRRRALVITGTGVTTAAFLAACGKGSSSTSTKESTGLVTPPTDSTATAVRGGTLKDQYYQDSPTLDPVNPIKGGAGNPVSSKVYSTLLREKPGHLATSTGELAPDIAESWEWSPDRLQVTLKLRQGVTFHNKSPVNGRGLDVDDILFSWNRFASKGSLRSAIVNSVSPDAPVISVTSTDPKTIVIKLKEPLAYALGYFASFGTFSGNIIIVPKESDTTLDLRSDMVGTGPYSLGKYQPSVSWQMKRHPGYFDQDYNYFDQVEMPILTEYATTLAQLKAGNVHYFFLRGEDVMTVKSDKPEIQIYSEGMSLINQDTLTFGLLPDGKSPFKDERVRQAVSMAEDRDLYAETFFNVSKFESQGFPMETHWHTSLFGDSGISWLDPKGKDFGPNAKYYMHNVADAKQLLSAAGYPNGVNINSHYVTNGTGSEQARFDMVTDGMYAEAGFHVTVQPADYTTQYIPLYRDGQGQYDGWAYHTTGGSTLRLLSAVSALAAQYWSKGGQYFKGFSTTGRNDKAGDPPLDAMIERARQEPDAEKQRSQVFDIQRYLAKAAWGLYPGAAATSFSMAWPAVRNYRTYQIQGRDIQPNASGYYKMWLDQTKPPFKSA